MFIKVSFTEEEIKQADHIKEVLDKLRLYLSQSKKGKSHDRQELLALADDVMENIAPMAERLGMHAEQKELLDASVHLAYPEDYARLKQLLQDSEAMCEMVFKTFTLPLRSMLDDLGIEYKLLYRMKSVYSIWRKMRIDHKEFDDVYDLFATRIIYKVPEDSHVSWDVQKLPDVAGLEPKDFKEENLNIEFLYCWRIYNVIAMLYRIHPDRVKNWINHPKPSGYQALQMTVMGPDCNWIEIQIRSERMDYDAEHGVAAHWKYKEETAVK